MAVPTSVNKEKISRTSPTEIPANPMRDSIVEVLSVPEAKLRNAEELDADPEVIRLQSWLEGRSRRRPTKVKIALMTTRRLNSIPFC